MQDDRCVKGRSCSLVLVLIAFCAPLAAQCPDTLRAEPGARTAGNFAAEFGRGLASDAWAVVTAPLRLERRQAWQFGGVLAIGGVMYAFDEEIMDALVRNREHPVSRALVETGEFVGPASLMGNTNGYWAAGIGVSYATGQERLQRMFEELLYSHWLAGLTRKAVGRPIGRMRPEEGFGPYEYRFLEGSSFPSGHASTMAQVATVLAHHIDRWPATVLLYGVAGALTYERAASEKHWVSDSWIGAAWGWGVARVVIARREGRCFNFAPVFDLETGAVGVRVPVPF